MEPMLPDKSAVLPLVEVSPVGQHVDEEGNATKTLGPLKFCIDVDRVEKHADALTKKVWMAALSPLVALGIGAYTAVMLLASDRIRARLTSLWIPRICSRIATRFSVERDELLSFVSGRVLDVGSGGGAYMRHFSSASQVVALEPVSDLHPKIVTSAKEAGIKNLTVLAMTAEMFLASDPNAARSFDWVILGNVLCEVPDQQSTLDAVDELIKVGGHAYFMEHIGHQRGTFLRKVQNFINPWWSCMSYGCNCNRDTLEEIHARKNWDVISWQYHRIGGRLQGPFVLGVACKKS